MTVWCDILVTCRQRLGDCDRFPDLNASFATPIMENYGKINIKEDI